MHELYDPQLAQFPDTRVAVARLGLIGGGQLALMTAHAAHAVGCAVAILEQNEHSPAVQRVPRATIGDWADPVTLAGFASTVDVLTFENEFVDASALRLLADNGVAVFPGAACLAITQDKLIQKDTLARAGLPVPRFRAVAAPGDVAHAAAEYGWPLVLKTRRNGYDGKGNFTVRSAADAAAGWARLGGGNNELLVEAYWPFAAELAVIVTRGRHGEIVTYPVVETIQRDHVCRAVLAPAGISPALAARAEEFARRAVTAVGGVGSFGVELFLSASGDLAINELAPRVHNSGHYTIEACACSQFENHVRAVLGWPLGSTRMTAPAAAMVNLLGTRSAPGRPQGLERALGVAGARVHLYGKSMSGPGRKMGHVTALGESTVTALAAAEAAARAIYFGKNE